LPRAQKIVVHLHGWASDKPEAVLEFPAGKPVKTTIPMSGTQGNTSQP
jgi:hypothetical protein